MPHFLRASSDTRMLNTVVFVKNALFVGSLIVFSGLVDCYVNTNLFGETLKAAKRNADIEKSDKRIKINSLSAKVGAKITRERIKTQFYGNQTCKKKWRKDELYSMKSLLCFRDNECRLFRDCCRDNIHLKPAMSRNMYQCTDIEHFEHFERKSVYTVVKCPEYFHGNPFIKNGCERGNQKQSRNQLLAVPVTGLYDGRIYANFNCAQCHRMPFIFWNVKIHCSKLDKTAPKSGTELTLKHFRKAKSCVTSYEPTSHQEDASCESYIATCPPISNKVKQKERLLNKIHTECLTRPLDKVYSSRKRTYKNVFCALCNGENLDNLDCLLVKTNLFEDWPLSFTVLFDFNVGHILDFRHDTTGHQNIQQLNQTTKAENNRCQDGYMYDFFSKKCRKVDFHRIPNLSSPAEGIVWKNNTPNECNSFKLINSKEIEWVEDVLKLKSTQEIVDTSSYFINGSSVYVCLNKLSNYLDSLISNKNTSGSTEILQTDKGNQFERRLTTIGLIISSVTLLIALLMVAFIKNMQRLPGKMMMSLMIAILVADTLFLLTGFARYSKIACILLAVILHYSLLASFFWNNVMSYDAWNTFSKLRPKNRKTRTFQYYSLYAWSVPLLIVGCSLTVDLLSSYQILESPWTFLVPHYGHQLCWISNRFALIIFFALPVFIITIANVCFFILTSKAIYRSDRYSSNYFSCKERASFGIYVKLCVIMGLTWIFSFLYPYTQLEVFRYISLFLNSFQGFFIGCIFLFSRNVRRLLHHQFPKRMTLRMIHSSSAKLISSLKASSQSY